MKNSHITRLCQWVRQTWRPTPLEKPVVDPLFPQMDALERSAESIRYSILSWEFWASPKGQVREWMRHNTRLVVLLFIPALIIIPIIGFALAQIAAWTIALAIIAAHLIIFTILAVVVLLIINTIFQIIKSLFR
jgi:hypothetical protein